MRTTALSTTRQGFSHFFLCHASSSIKSGLAVFTNESEQESRGPSSIQYVNELRERLTEAYALADEHARAQGKASKRRYDQRVRPSGLEVGGRGLLRNVDIRERRKLSNSWLPDVYVVLRQQGANRLQFT